MRIGVTVPNVHETLAERTTIEAVGRMADDLGFDSIWCNDHLAIPRARDDAGAEPAYAAAYGEQRGQNIYEPLIVLAYLAAVTRRVALGTSVYLLPLRHPLLAAKQAVSLDRLSEGRLVLGAGRASARAARGSNAHRSRARSGQTPTSTSRWSCSTGRPTTGCCCAPGPRRPTRWRPCSSSRSAA